MAKKKKELNYGQNLVVELKETWQDIKDPIATAIKLVKDIWSLGVQIVNLVGQLIPVVRKLIANVKKVKLK